MRNSIVTDSGCWEWTKARNSPNGYGRVRVDGRLLLAHRVAYEELHGPIPEGMTVDHLCFNPPCVNPSHLRLLTNRENALNRRNVGADACKWGHPYTPDNILSRRSGVRGCKTCHRERERIRKSQNRTAA